MIRLWFEENIGIPIWEFFHQKCDECRGCGTVPDIVSDDNAYWYECPICRGKGYLTLWDKFYWWRVRQVIKARDALNGKKNEIL